ncbi:MAG TPA: ATP-binding protein [Rhodanobacteraceae bacterium]
MRWRLAVLLFVVVVSVLLPYLISRTTTNNALEASRGVAHTAQIRVTVYKLLYRLRDTEAATYSVLQGVSSGNLDARIDRSENEIVPLLATLRGLTIDNPDQQARLGALKAVIQHRIALMQLARKQYAAGDTADAYRALGKAANAYPYGRLSEDIVHASAQMQIRRDAVAQHKIHMARLVQMGAAIAQLLLLGLVALVSERSVIHRLHAERVSRQAVARAERIVQTVREPMAVLDSQLDLLMANAAFDEMYGQTGADLAGKDVPVRALASVGSGAWTNDALRQRLVDVLARDRELWDYPLAQTTMDGVDRHMLVNARRMQLPDGDAPAILLSVSDVTARTLAEHRVNELNHQLEGKIDQLSEVNHELEAFSYSVSHDLRAPLRHIAGFSDKLERHLGDDVDEKAAHYLDVIGSAATHMAQLIDGLLVYSRLGRDAMRMQPVDMQSLVAETRDLVAGDAGDRDIAWRVGWLPMVVGDENMLRSVWQNLMGNAVKYTGKREHAEISVNAEHTSTGEYVFSVRDNGAGFDMTYADKLFGVFQRMHKASDFPGSGIGLANVRRIIMRHGGRTWAESAPDRGASFHFSLPAPRGASA